MRTMCIGERVQTTILLEFGAMVDRHGFQQLMLESMRGIVDEMREEATAEYEQLVALGKRLGL